MLFIDSCVGRCPTAKKKNRDVIVKDAMHYLVFTFEDVPHSPLHLLFLLDLAAAEVVDGVDPTRSELLSKEAA
jgi:hypothetical protein